MSGRNRGGYQPQGPAIPPATVPAGMTSSVRQPTAAIKQGAADFAADLTAATHAGWRAGANAMRAEALASCGVILRLLETRAISGSAFDIVKALQKQIESSPIADVPETMQEAPHE